MSDNSGEGGTKIQRRNVQQIPVQQMNNQMDPRGMGGGGGQRMSEEEMMMMQQRQQMMMQQQQQQQMGGGGGQQDPRMIQQQMMQQQMMEQQMMQQQIPKGILKKSSLKNNNSSNKFCFSWNNVNIKNSIIVFVLFILLNSRIIWRALSRMPMMGTVEPSILALVVNSLIAGIVFYFVTTKLSK